MNKNNNTKNLKEITLTLKEKTQLGIQSIIQAIPYVGSSISTLYFGYKQEIKYKRLESYFKELTEEIEKIKNEIKPFKFQDREAFIFILENLSEKVEIEYDINKRKYFKNYFKSMLKEPINKSNFNERRYFLDILGSMSILECEILKILIDKNNVFTQIGDFKIKGVDLYVIIGAIEKLKSYGFLESRTTAFRIGTGQDNRLFAKVKLSEFGKNFFKFCIE